MALTHHQRVEYLDATRRLDDVGLSLTRAVEIALASRPRANVPLRQVIEETVQAKQAANRRPRYIDSLRNYLAQFAAARQDQPVGDFSASTIVGWFARRHEAPATRRANLGRLSALFTLARRRGYISHNPCDDVERVTVERRVPMVLSVEECERLMTSARSHNPRLVPFQSLALFAGVRPGEIGRLSWRGLDLQRGLLTIDSAARTRSRRIVHLSLNCTDWLRMGGDLPISDANYKRASRGVRKATEARDASGKVITPPIK